MKLDEAFKLSLNVVLLALFYTIVGGTLSYFVFYLVEEHEPTWDDRPVWFQLTDIVFQISAMALIAYWLGFVIRISPPLIPVNPKMYFLADSHISGIFFAYAMFIHMDGLFTKIKHMYTHYTEDTMDVLFGNEGSIIDLTLKYNPKKVEHRWEEYQAEKDEYYKKIYGENGEHTTYKRPLALWWFEPRKTQMELDRETKKQSSA
jgi:hypothetical protein